MEYRQINSGVNVKLVKILIMILLFQSFLSAQTENEIKLNLEESIKIALENNSDLKQIKLDYKKAKEQVWEAYGTSLFPSIDGNVSYQRAVKQGVIIIETPFFSGSFPQGTKNTLTASVSLEQPLFTGAMFLATRIAETFANISEENVEYSKSDLITKVKEAYYNILLAQEFVKLGKLNLNLAKKNLDDTESMYNAGLSPEYDFLKAKVNYQNLIPALTEVENQLNLSKNNMKFLLGFDLSQKITVTDSLKYSEISDMEMNEAIKMLEENNKLINQLKLDQELKDLTASYQFSKHFPELNLTGTYQAQAQENDDKSFSNWYYINSFYVGLNLKVPIFKGFSIDSKAEQAEIDLLKAQEELIKTKRNLINQLESTMLNINKAKEQIEAYELSVSEAFRGYEISKQRFDAGLGTQLEVTNALVVFSQTKVNYLTGVRDYYVYNSLLDHLVGENNILLNKN